MNALTLHDDDVGDGGDHHHRRDYFSLFFWLYKKTMIHMFRGQMQGEMTKESVSNHLDRMCDWVCAERERKS